NAPLTLEAIILSSSTRPALRSGVLMQPAMARRAKAAATPATGFKIFGMVCIVLFPFIFPITAHEVTRQQSGFAMGYFPRRAAEGVPIRLHSAFYLPGMTHVAAGG